VACPAHHIAADVGEERHEALRFVVPCLSGRAGQQQRLVRRGRGPVVAELADALRWRRAGMPLPAALETLARHTCEPHAARTYRTLAKAATSGAEIADALRALAEDVRNSRRDALQRLAVKRRATMIIPIVFLLVPPLLLLVGAPLYAELFGGLP
jgi:tight adherence protein C